MKTRHFRGISEKLEKVFEGVLSGLYVLTGLYALFIIWKHLNYLQIDLAGHMASGSWFERGFFHQYQDHNFLGYVHGLFYPPLEDFILTLFNLVFSFSKEFAYKSYLSVLIVSFLSSIYWLGTAIGRPLAKICYWALALAVVWLSKGDGLYFQGLSLNDLLITGLSSQVLGGVFLFLLLREWLGRFRAAPSICFLTLCILSHIVVALVVLSLFAVEFLFVRRARKTVFLTLAFSLAISSFYLIPFVFYKGQITTAKIVGESLWPFAGVLLGFVLALWRRPFSKGQILLLVSLLLTLPSVLGPQFPAIERLLPRFHYYRFAIFSLYMGIAGICVESSIVFFHKKNWIRKSLLTVFAAAIGLFFVSRFSFLNIPLNSWEFSKVTLDLKKMGPTSFPEYGRYWVIGTHRSADFGLDSLLQVYDPHFRSAKGLYWESSKNNLLLSSYLATLLSSPVVLDHFFYWGYSCPMQKCLMEHFFRDYNIHGVMVQSDLQLQYISPERRQCFSEFFERPETDQYRLKKVGEFNVSGVPYSNFWISRKQKPPVAMTNTNSVIELFHFSRMVPFEKRNQDFFSDYIKSAFMSCQVGMMSDAIFLERDQYSQLQSQAVAAGLMSTDLSKIQGNLNFTRVAPGRFRVNVPGDQDVLIRIKLNYFPLFRLFRADGTEVKLYDAFPSMVAIGHGELTLEFQRSWIMVVSYILSIISLGLLVIFWKRLQGFRS